MAINLISPIKPSANLAGIGNKISIVPQGSPNAGAVSTAPPIGIRAKTPVANAPTPPTTLPANQKSTVQPTATVLPPKPAVQPEVPVQPVSPVNSSQQRPVSYGGLIGQLISQNNSPNAQAARAAAGGLFTTAQNNQGTSGPAYQDYQNKVNELQNLKSGIASKYGSIESQPIPLEFQQGREQALGRQYASQLQAGQEAVNQAQQGVGFQLTGAGLQQSGLNQAGSLALTGNQQQLGALQQAATLAQPQLGSIGQVPFSPIDQNQGQILGTAQPGGVSTAGNLLGQFSGAQAVGAAPGQTQASNIQTSGTAVQGANASAYQQALPAYYQMQSQLQNVEGLGNLLLNTAQGGQINPFDPQFANLTVGQLRNQLSSPDQVRFNSTLASFQGAASQLLASGSGQIPTDVSHNISLLASGNLSMGALKAMVDQAQKEGSVKLGNQAAIVNQSLQTLQQGSGTQSNYGGGGLTWDSL